MPKLVSLVVIGAVHVHGDDYYETVDALREVRVTATTNPPDVPVNWDAPGTEDGGEPNERVVSRTNVDEFEVTAELGGVSLTRTIYIVDLVTYTSTLPATAAARTWKAYENDPATVLTVQTNPDTPEVWDLVRWNEGVRQNPASNQSVTPGPTAGDRIITAKLGLNPGKVVSGTLHVCAWPELKLTQVEFSGGHTVERDTKGLFENRWVGTRPPNKQSPLCYTQGQPITVKTTFAVTKKPTDPETIQVRGSTTLRGRQLDWGPANIVVNPGAGYQEVVFPTAASAGQLLPQVDCHDPMDIAWEMTRRDGSWHAVTSSPSRNVLYVTLGDPSGTPAYWTLLDVSCRNNIGTTTPDGLVAGFYPAFVNGKGTGNGIRRKRDNQELSYWRLGIDSPQVFETSDLLGTPTGPTEGSGRCGSWAELMVDMCKVHGVTTASDLEVVPANPDVQRFLVKNCSFTNVTAGTRHPPFRYDLGTGCDKEDGLPGQGWNNPQSSFPNHALVRYGGQIYDPSYGTGPYPDVATWEHHSLDGGGPNDPHDFMKFGVQLRMPRRCAPGFATHVSTAGQTLDSIAVHYTVTDGMTLRAHVLNVHLATQDPAAALPVGTRVYIPKQLSASVRIVRES